MGILRHRRENAADDGQGSPCQPSRSKEELLAMLLEKRREAMEKLTSEEALLAIIHAEGLDATVDFKLNTDFACEHSVRLNRQPDGSYLLYTVGERGVDWQETFQDPKEAYYIALQTVRNMKGMVERANATAGLSPHGKAFAGLLERYFGK